MKTTNIVSEERLEELKQRSKRCVCKYCGGNLKVRLIDFGEIATANMEIFCEKCDKIEYGVEPEVYKNAVYFVDNIGFSYNNEEIDNEVMRRFNIAKVCDIISWHEKQIGILDQNGYKVDLHYDETELDCADGSMVFLGESLSDE